MTRPACFLTWIEHRRTRSLCEQLGIELAEIVTARRGLARYAELIPRTLAWLWRCRPSVLLVQSPSMVLAALTVLLRPLIGYRLVFDAHNEAVQPYVHPSASVVALARWLMRKADHVIVTNPGLATTVTQCGGKPVILPDPLPEPPGVTPRPLPGDFRVAVISTFAPDEPFEAVIAAARRIGEDVRLYVTGNPDKLSPETRAAMPGNMTLTGFLSEPDYWSLLASCDAVMDLTTMENCLVCGAYEAIAVGRPVLLSDNAASVATFAGFGEFTSNEPEAIAAALQRLRARCADLTAELPARRREFLQRWQAQAQVLRNIIEARPATSAASAD